MAQAAIVFDSLDAQFHFTQDACATQRNAKCAFYFTKAQDGLRQNWRTHGVFCNPPYGREMRTWARKCFEASRSGALVVLLAHARTDTRWFHEWVYGKVELRFLKGRLKFWGRNAVGSISLTRGCVPARTHGLPDIIRISPKRHQRSGWDRAREEAHRRLL
jgi:phage N-6-adenine-methyltransferase